MRKSGAPLRILLADDHVTVRHGLKLLIEGQADMKVVCESSDGKAAIRDALAFHPDVIVMDISMPELNGLAATRKLKKLLPDAAIVTLTRHSDDAYLQELLRAGVAGYVLKQSEPHELLQAIRAVAAGGQYLDSALTAKVTAAFLDRDGKRTGKAVGTLERAGSRGFAADRVGLQQQGDCRPTGSEREDGRSAQGQCHAEARTDWTHRHREVRASCRGGWIKRSRGSDLTPEVSESPDSLGNFPNPH